LYFLKNSLPKEQELAESHGGENKESQITLTECEVRRDHI
jgi:hypothetical protein